MNQQIPLPEIVEKNLSIARMFLKAPTMVPLAEEIVLKDIAQNHTYRGRVAVQYILLAFLGEGFSEVTVEQQALLADEKTAMMEFVFNGCHTGIFMSIPATGQRVVVPMVLVCQISDGNIHHINWYYDAGTLLRQLRLAL